MSRSSPVRETSATTYRAVQDSGLLSRRRSQVYGALYVHGPCTINELYKKMFKVNNVQANLHARMGELREMGVVAEVHERPCSVTGQTVIEWMTTDNMATKPKKKTEAGMKCAFCDGTGRIFE